MQLLWAKYMRKPNSKGRCLLISLIKRVKKGELNSWQVKSLRDRPCSPGEWTENKVNKVSDVSLVKWDKLRRLKVEGEGIIMEHEQEEEELNSNYFCLGGGTGR